MGAPELTRVVCDTNVVVSTLLFTAGRLSWLREAWRPGHLVPLFSRGTVAELLRVLQYPKFGLQDDERQELLGDYLPFVEIVQSAEVPPEIPPCKDPNDRMFLELAITGEAELLITGDPDLSSWTEPPRSRPPAKARSRLTR